MPYLSDITGGYETIFMIGGGAMIIIAFKQRLGGRRRAGMRDERVGRRARPMRRAPAAATESLAARAERDEQ